MKLDALFTNEDIEATRIEADGGNFFVETIHGTVVVIGFDVVTVRTGTLEEVIESFADGTDNDRLVDGCDLIAD